MRLSAAIAAAGVCLSILAASAQTAVPPPATRAAAAEKSLKPAVKTHGGHFVTIASPRRTQAGEMPQHVCTGVLIARQHVLTSAGCLSETKDGSRMLEAANVEVYFGGRIDPASKPLTVSAIVRHPEYDSALRRADLAIVQLAQPAPEGLQPMALATDAEASMRAMVQLGWMLDSNDHQIIAAMPMPPVAADRCEAALRDDVVEKAQGQYVDLVKAMQVSPQVAATAWRALSGAMPRLLSAGLFCAAPADGVPCDTDAGAALVSQAAGAPQLVGVLSSMPACETAGMPGLYTSIVAHRPWIQQTIAQSAPVSPPAPAASQQRQLPAAVAAARLAAVGSGAVNDSVRTSRPNASQRIVGGVAAVPGFYPFQVSLILAETGKGDEFSGFYCGGTRIGERHVLTAAHCLVRGQDKALAAGDVHVYLGHVDFRGGERIPVSRVSLHPGWNSTTLVDDIAVLELERAPAASPLVGAIDVMKAGAPHPTRARAIGWGATDFQGASSRTLRETPMAVIDRATCDQTYRSFETRAVRTVIGEVAQLMGLSRSSEDKIVRAVTDGSEARIGQSVICAGSLVGARSTCQGDSGGPLFSEGADGKPVQIGVVSWGVACDTRNVYGVFTDVSKYSEWIAEAMR